jgi:hypothetical protein
MKWSEDFLVQRGQTGDHQATKLRPYSVAQASAFKFHSSAQVLPKVPAQLHKGRPVRDVRVLCPKSVAPLRLR